MTDAQRAETRRSAGERKDRTFVQEHRADIRQLERLHDRVKVRSSWVEEVGKEFDRSETSDDILSRQLAQDAASVRSAAESLAATLDAIEHFQRVADYEADRRADRDNDTPDTRGEPRDRPPRREPPRVPPVRTDPPVEPDDPSEFIEPIIVPKLPKPADVMYLIEGDRVTRQSDGKQLSDNMSPGVRALRDAYAQGRSGVIPIGIAGPAFGNWSIGGANSKWSADSVCELGSSRPVELALVGMNESARVQNVQLTSLQTEVHDIRFYGVGVMGAMDPYIMRQIGEVGLCLLDGCWWVDNPNYVTGGRIHRTGLGVGHGWDAMIVRNQKRTPGQLLEEHDVYAKGGGPGGLGSHGLKGMLAIVTNEFGAGNRTWFQVRPHQASKYSETHSTPPQSGPVLVRGNYGKDFGQGHDKASGGSLVTVWTSLDRTIIEDNRGMGNNRYGCVSITQGGPDTKPYLTPDGYSHARTLYRNNQFENPNGDRACVSISAADETILAGENYIGGSSYGDLVLDSEFAAKQDAERNRSVRIIGPDALALDADVRTYRNGQHMAFPAAELEAMREGL